MEKLTGVLNQSDIKFDGMITSKCSGDNVSEVMADGRKVRNGKSTCQPESLKRAYDIVLCDKLEPMRERYDSLPNCLGPKLLNMQQLPPIVPEKWSCKRPKQSVLREFRLKPRITNQTSPKEWDRVIRIIKPVPVL